MTRTAFLFAYGIVLGWFGARLARGLIRTVTTLYPDWHAALPVAEGFDLDRTHGELGDLLPAALLDRVTLTRQARPGAKSVRKQGKPRR